MTTQTTESRFAGRYRAADILGISSGAMLILQRDNILPPDCLSCGRIAWKIKDLEEHRDKVRTYLSITYPHLVEKLIVSE
jgi:hypothetical protein